MVGAKKTVLLKSDKPRMKVMLPKILHLLPVEVSLDVEGIGSARTNYQIMQKNYKQQKRERGKTTELQ
jgi:hypothetical protein